VDQVGGNPLSIVGNLQTKTALFNLYVAAAPFRSYMSVRKIHSRPQAAPVLVGRHADAVLEDNVAGVVVDENVVHLGRRLFAVNLIKLQNGPKKYFVMFRSG
jgi:hypothetical protein